MALPIFQRTIVTSSGDVIAGAQLEVRHESSGALAVLYRDREGVTLQTNPFSSDADGLATFYAESGEYRITATGETGSADWRYYNLLHITESATDTTKGRLLKVGDNVVRTVSDISSLLAIETTDMVDGHKITVLRYHTERESGELPYCWDATRAKSEHNGGTIIDPDKTFPDFTSEVARINWYTGDGTGQGCYVYNGNLLTPEVFGAIGDSSVDRSTLAITIGSDNAQALQKIFEVYDVSTGRHVLHMTPNQFYYSSQDISIGINFQIEGNGSALILGDDAVAKFALADNSGSGYSYTELMRITSLVVNSLDFWTTSGFSVHLNNVIDGRFTDCLMNNVLYENTNGRWTEANTLTRCQGDFTFRVSGGTNSFGYNKWRDCIWSAQLDGSIGMTLESGGLYNCLIDGNCWLRGDAGHAVQPVFMKSLGGDCKYTTFNLKCEDFGTGATLLDFDDPSSAAFKFNNGSLTAAAGTEVVGVGTCYRNDIQVKGFAADHLYQGRERSLRLTNRFEDLTPSETSLVSFEVADPVALGDKIYMLPAFRSEQIISRISVSATTAGSGNTGGRYYFGIRKGGATNPVDVFFIEDGQTNAVVDFDHVVNPGWLDSATNHITAKPLSGVTGNDGTAPQGLRFTIELMSD